MSRNNWIVCAIAGIVFLCLAVSCLVLASLGIAGYIFNASSTTNLVTDQPPESADITPSPVVIRPTPFDTSPPTDTPSSLSSGNPDDSALPPPEIYPLSGVVPTDTLKALEEAIMPVNDPIELAHRLLGLENLSPTITPPLSFHEKGDQMSFWIGNDTDENFLVPATLQYVTPHAYFWIEDGVRYSQSKLSALADSFENQIYPTNRAFFGSEWTPGVDGDPHIYIVYARGLGESIAGYYSSADEYPPLVNHLSNAHEMFVFNADNSPLDDPYTFGVLAHELQHMIHWFQDRNESSWIDEGFSELAALLNGYYSGGFDALYTANPDIQLNYWPDDTQEDSTPHYGASFLFVNYFLDRFGESATQALVAHPENDLASLDATLTQIGATDPLTAQSVNADDFFLDWAITNYLMDDTIGDGRFAYKQYLDTPSVEPSQSFSRCPVDAVTSDVHQFGADYIRITCPGTHTLHFEGSIQTPLLPQDPHSGNYAFWSNRGDEIDTILTQTFDFTGHTAPITLSYWTWYDIEDGWDYAYLEASLDGETWQILTTPSGTSLDPQGNSYGWGYTGFSGGHSPVWLHETVDLSQFAGRVVSLRFEYITDSNVTGEGFILDDISIPEIGYFTNFESGSGGWLPEGWVRIQNALPQNYRLALISVGNDTQVQYIPLAADTSADFSFTIGDGVDEVILVVSGTTRFTRQLAPYRFSVR